MLRDILTQPANTLREGGAIDERESFIDATLASAKGGGEDIGSSPGQRRQREVRARRTSPADVSTPDQS